MLLKEQLLANLGLISYDFERLYVWLTTFLLEATFLECGTVWNICFHMMELWALLEETSFVSAPNMVDFRECAVIGIDAISTSTV